VAHPVEEQHRQLAILFEDTRAALDRAEPGAAREPFEQLREALDAHFELEDHLYYPPIAALRPRHKAVVSGIAEAHARFRTAFGEIASALEGGVVSEARRAFAEFTESFARHEVIEEELVRALESEGAAAG